MTKNLFTIFAAVLGAFLFSYAVFAFTFPTTDPPGDNVDASINVGPDSQVKAGGLWVGSLGTDGDIYDDLGGVIFNSTTRKIEESALPFSKGDIVDPGDRSLISGLAGYATQYFRLNNLGISGTDASEVQCGKSLGPNNVLTGSYCASPGQICSAGSCGLGPGQKRVFVTSTQFFGDFGGLSSGDSICQSRAGAAGLGGTWKAWLSDSATDAKDRITDAQYVRTDGVIVANSLNDLLTLISGTLNVRLRAPISKDEFGNLHSGATIMTGTYTGGTKSPWTCNNWTTKTSSLGQAGSSTAMSTGWTSWGSSSCTTAWGTKSIYCFEQ